MIRVKHFLDTAEADDGHRLWIEPIGLTRDLQQMCQVHHLLPHLGPPMHLWQWYQQHPDGWEYFRGKYHEHLASSPQIEALQDLANAAMKQDFTLLHESDDPIHNTATALHEFIAELQAYLPSEEA